MPYKYVIRNLRENAYYHVYNIGVENRDIFLDKGDYETFLYYLHVYTLPWEEVIRRYPSVPPRLMAKNLNNNILVIAYCLMPNHFHLLVKQKTPSVLPKLMKQLVNGYTTYFNGKHKRAGSLFRGRYKSVVVESEYLLLQMVRFVHLNPSQAELCDEPGEYGWSSYNNPVYTNELIGRFGSIDEWERFHLDLASYQLNEPKIKHLTID